MTLTIKTDHKWHQFKYRTEVPASVLKSEFDYQIEEDALDGFFCYRGHWYHIDSFMTTGGHNSPLAAWHAYAGDSFFSGVVIRISKDGETYQVGTYMS